MSNGYAKCQSEYAKWYQCEKKSGCREVCKPWCRAKKWFRCHNWSYCSKTTMDLNRGNCSWRESAALQPVKQLGPWRERPLQQAAATKIRSLLHKTIVAVSGPTIKKNCCDSSVIQALTRKSTSEIALREFPKPAGNAGMPLTAPLYYPVA